MGDTGRGNGNGEREGVSRTAPGLRDAMFDLLDDLRNGRATPPQARAQCETADRIMDTVRMEAMELAVMQAQLEMRRSLKLLGEGKEPPMLSAQGGSGE